MSSGRLFLIVPILFLISAQAKCQDFGSSFDLLLKETNARTAALGGFNVSLVDDDVQLITGNPAVANGKMRRSLGLTYNPSLAGIRQLNTIYSDSLPLRKDSRLPRIVFAGLQYLDYGNFQMTDQSGASIGNFTANQYCFSIGTAQRTGNFGFGLALKFAGLQINGLHATAICADLGGIFRHPSKDLTIGLSLKNIGFQTSRFFSDGQSIPIPLNIQAGISYRLQHMPLRFSVTTTYLQNPDIQYVDPNAPGKLDLNGKLVREEKKITEQFFRHFCIGGEFLMHRAFNLRVGYNHLRRKEWKTESGSGLTGYSLGFTINTKLFNIAYTYSGWQRGLGLHFMSMNLRLGQFYRR
jgi:hypothetical protein